MLAVRRFAAALADLLLPPICLGCDGLIDTRDAARLLCRRCRARLRPIPSPTCVRCGASLRVTGRSPGEDCAECAEWPRELVHARSVCLLLAPADRVVHQLKYRNWPALAEPMAERMADLVLPPRMRAATTCVPVPTTAQRLRDRGYNQAAELARALARRTNRAMRPILMRSGGTGSQTALLPAARRANVAGAFRVDARYHTLVRGQDLLLVDDVLTTGATARACSLALIDAGAASVSLLTFARALDARRLTRSNGDDDARYGWKGQ